jgi:SNF2 family DNA or RNA helicase
MTRWHLTSTPYKVQTEALKSSDHERGWAYFMEMGLGKTAVCWSEFIDLYGRDVVEYMIVVCPNSLKSNWIAEAAKQGVAGVDCTIWPAQPSSGVKMIAVNYEALLTKNGQSILPKILDQHKVYLVFDESIHLKNPQAKRTKLAINLSKSAAVVRVLSGAPVTKSPMDLWGQLKVIGKTGKLNPYAFRNHFCVMGGYLGKQIVGGRNEDELEAVLSASSFRAKKKDWTDLPEKSFTVREYKMTKGQQDLYDTMHRDFMISLNNDTITAPMAITQAMKLQQISSGFIIDEERFTHALVENKNNPKLQLLQDVIEEAGNKVLVFAFYRRTIQSLLDTFPGCTYIVGGMKDEDIEEQKRLFNETEANPMICQISAAKYGHTLLGTETLPCHTSVFYENNYDLDARLQSEDRNHRHGQKHAVGYIDFIGTSMDKKVITALVKKQSIANAIMLGGSDE